MSYDIWNCLECKCKIPTGLICPECGSLRYVFEDEIEDDGVAAEWGWRLLATKKLNVLDLGQYANLANPRVREGITCAKCQNKCEGDARFCSNCGQKL
jgi:membrane protease subunit (stomatin/prohibitin family)